MVMSWLLGIILILIIGIDTFSLLWLQIKLILVFSLSIYNEYLGQCVKLLKLGENKKSAKFSPVSRQASKDPYCSKGQELA